MIIPEETEEGQKILDEFYADRQALVAEYDEWRNRHAQAVLDSSKEAIRAGWAEVEQRVQARGEKLKADLEALRDKLENPPAAAAAPESAEPGTVTEIEQASGDTNVAAPPSDAETAAPGQ